MHKKNGEQKASNISRRRVLIICAAAAVAIILPLMLTMTRPERSVEAFCSAYEEENAKLPKPTDSSQEVFGVAGLTSSSQNPRLFADAFDRLEKVAPEDIRPDVSALKKVFEEIDADPSKLLGAGLSGLSAEVNIKEWTSRNCSIDL